MRRIFTIFLLATGTYVSLAQRAICPIDTIKYALAKASAIDTLTLNTNITSAVYQYFECPQEINITGARFYGFKPDTIGGATMTLTVELRKIANDSVPGSNLISSGTVTLGIPDSLNGPFNMYAHAVTWPSISVDFPYAIVIKADSGSPNFRIMHNHLTPTSSDGDQEWLSGAYQSGWIRSYIYNPTGIPFDADFFIEPVVQYNLNASFIHDPECLFNELGDTVYFYNDGSVIVDSKMYNRFAYYGFPDMQRWNYGDGSLPQNWPNPQHFYPTNGPYAATMTAKILSWTQQVCQSTVTQIIKEKPAQDFSYISNNLDVQFKNETFGLFTNIHYEFGDGNSSSSLNPKHKYAKPGTYWVCQSMTTSCGDVTYCKNVAVATNTALNCGKDSVRYTSARGTKARVINLKNPPIGSKLLGVGQRFDIPQSMIIHGFTFYANHDGLFKDSYPVTCRIWRKGPNNLPLGNPLAESIVHINKNDVDTNYSDTVRYTAIFNKPINVKKDSDVIFTIEYDSNAVYVQITTNDWIKGDGDQDLLAIGKINPTTWVTAASVAVFNCNGAPCDCDIVIEPLVEYNIDANFSWSYIANEHIYNECLTFDPTAGNRKVVFKDLSSPIIRYRIWNTIPFIGSSVFAYEWDFGDSTGISNQIDAEHIFEEPGPFDVELKIIVDGWTHHCENIQVLNIPVSPTGGWEYEQITSEVRIFDRSYNAVEYLWKFSDSTKSTLKNPVHYFTHLGKFSVCQFVSNVCGSDTTCDSITVNVVGIPESETRNIQIYPNPTRDYININTGSEGDQNIDLILFDMSGQVIRKTSIRNYTQKNWYVGDLARGMYLLQIRIGDYIGTKPFILAN